LMTLFISFVAIFDKYVVVDLSSPEHVSLGLADAVFETTLSEKKDLKKLRKKKGKITLCRNIKKSLF
jgi:hypothetical protein